MIRIRKLADWLKCTFVAHEVEIVPLKLKLKDGIKPTPTVEMLAVLLGKARCKRCGKDLPG